MGLMLIIRLDLHRSRVDIHRSRLDICRSKVDVRSKMDNGQTLYDVR